MPVLKAIPILLSAMLLAACAAPPTRPSTIDPTLQIEAVDDSNATVAPDAAAGLRFASFPLIAGAMSGPATTDPVFYLPVQFGYATQLPLGELARRVAPLAVPPTEQMQADGLTVTPAGTRLARVGSFFVQREADRIDVGAGFIDDVTRETFFLVYFDRGCQVSGTVHAGGVEIEVRVAVQDAGMYWLRVRKDDATHWRLAPDDTQAAIALVTTGQR